MDTELSEKSADTAVVVIQENIYPKLWFVKSGGIPLFLRALLALKRVDISKIHVILSSQTEFKQYLHTLVSDSRLSDIDITFKPPHAALPSRPFWLVAANLVWSTRLWRYLKQEDLRILKNKEGGIIPFLYVDPAASSNIDETITVLQAQNITPRNFFDEKAFNIVSLKEDLGIQISKDSDLKKAQKMLFRSDFKHTDGIASRFLNRPLSRRISSLLIDTSISPHTISYFVFLLGLIAIYFTQKGGYYPMLIGAAIFQLNSIADGIDGEIARIKFQDSYFGEWLDRILDKIVMVLFFAAIFIGHFRHYQNSIFFAIGLFTVIGAAVGFTLNYLYGFRFKHEIMHRIENPSGKIQKIRDRGMAAMTFGSVNTKNLEHDQEKLTMLKIINYILKNDFLGYLYLGLAMVGLLHIALFIIFPYVLLNLTLSMYGLAQLTRALFQDSSA